MSGTQEALTSRKYGYGYVKQIYTGIGILPPCRATSLDYPTVVAGYLVEAKDLSYTNGLKTRLKNMFES